MPSLARGLCSGLGVRSRSVVSSFSNSVSPVRGVRTPDGAIISAPGLTTRAWLAVPGGASAVCMPPIRDKRVCMLNIEWGEPRACVLARLR